MSGKLTYLDSGVLVLISAFWGEPSISIRAAQILDDDTRQFATSGFVQLETLPKALYNKQLEEAEFYEAFFSSVTVWATDLENILKNGDRIARTYGLAAMDAMHIAAALSVYAEEFITTEKLTKPMHRVTELVVISIAIE